MASTLTWVLAGVVVYTVGAMALRTRGLLPEYVRVSGPIVTLHTKRGRQLLDRLSAPRRFWRAWSNVGIGIALVVMVGFGLVVLFSAVLIGLRPEQAANSPVRNPQNALVIPGVNEFLPLSVAPEIVVGLLVGMVVHEGGHGLLCRVEDIDIDSMGVALFAFIPIGAFVEPDDESRSRVDRGAQTRMFAAGVTNNFALTAVAFLLLFGPVVASIGVAPGLPVGDALAGSAAASADIGYGDRITAVNGTDVSDEAEFEAALADIESPTVSLTLADGRTVPVERQLFIRARVEGVLGGIAVGGDRPPTIETVNGTDVATERAFEAAVADRTVARIGTDNGTATIPVGAFVAETESAGPLAGAGAPNGTALVITRIGGERVVDTAALVTALESYDPGDRVTVEAFVDGERTAYDVKLGGTDGEARLGVRTRSGYSGIVVEDVGVDRYPAEFFLALLGGGDGEIGGPLAGSLLANVRAVLVMPFLTVFAPDIAYNFAGFTSEVANFYVLEGPLGALGGGVFVLANLLFWTGWINLNLALFNCIPAFPLDGGHMLRTSTESIVARLPVSNRRTLATTVTTAITLTMIVALVVMLFGPALLA